MTFDWNSPRQLAAYFALHKPFEQQGIDFFWLDWCCDGPQSSVPGLTEDTWINSQYYAEQRARGLALAGVRTDRWRVRGEWRRWPRQRPRRGRRRRRRARRAPLHDPIHRRHLRDLADAGVRGTAERRGGQHRAAVRQRRHRLLQRRAREPSVRELRLPGHRPPRSPPASCPTTCTRAGCSSGPSSRWTACTQTTATGFPWEYGPAADAAATTFLQLREALNPYIYTLARRSYDTGLPITGALYLQWPAQPAAYQHPSEYTFGPEMVVEPVTTPGDPAPATMWVPPGTWIDYFTGQRYRGPALADAVGAALADAGAGACRSDRADPAVHAVHAPGAPHGPHHHRVSWRQRELYALRRPGGRIRVSAQAFRLDTDLAGEGRQTDDPHDRGAARLVPRRRRGRGRGRCGCWGWDGRTSCSSAAGSLAGGAMTLLRARLRSRPVGSRPIDPSRSSPDRRSSLSRFAGGAGLESSRPG